MTQWEKINLTGVIYRIGNLINGKSYIGQTINWFNERYGGGKWWKNTDSPLLKEAVNKYGIENFEVRVLAYNIQTIEELNSLEIKYIFQYKSFVDDEGGYNLTRGGNDNIETSKETREKLSKAQIGKKRPAELIAKMANDRKIPVVQLNKKTKELIKRWPSARDAEKQLSIWKGNITKACRKDLKSAGGFCWEYIENLIIK